MTVAWPSTRRPYCCTYESKARGFCSANCLKYAMPRIGFSMYHTPCCRPELDTLTLMASFHFGSSRSSHFLGASAAATLLGLYAMPAMMIDPKVEKPSCVRLYHDLR